MKSAVCPVCGRHIRYELMLDNKWKFIDHLNQEGNLCKGSRKEVNE